MTQEDWDAKWLMLYDRAWMEFKDHNKSFAFAHKKMLALHGPRPDGAPGPPWWTKVLALSLGVNMTKLWEWLNGKKTVMGIIITVLAWLAANIPAILPVVGIEAALVAKITGILLTVVGIAHKVYKFLYKEEHP